MYELRAHRKVEFSDTDMAGIVHFSRLIVFMENAEHAFIEALGGSVSMHWRGNAAFACTTRRLRCAPTTVP